MFFFLERDAARDRVPEHISCRRYVHCDEVGPRALVADERANFPGTTLASWQVIRRKRGARQTAVRRHREESCSSLQPTE